MTLDQWLRRATRRLSPESVEKVHAEIGEHYEAALASGTSYEDAVCALGDAKDANREYRKVLLTQLEAAMAPAYTQPKRPTLKALFVSSAVFAVITWTFSRSRNGSTIWPVMAALWLETLFPYFVPLNTPDRDKILLRLGLVRDVVVMAVAWWFQGWESAAITGLFLVGLRWLLRRPRVAVLRKLAGGQTFSPFPGEPELTHDEAAFLNTLRNGDPSQKYALPFLFVMLTALAVWQPRLAAPLAISMTVCFALPRVFPVFYTGKWSQWYRIGKWMSLVLAAVLPIFLGGKAPWVVAPYIAFLFRMFEWKRISLRRKLPVEEWPKELYL